MTTTKHSERNHQHSTPQRAAFLVVEVVAEVFIEGTAKTMGQPQTTRPPAGLVGRRQLYVGRIFKFCCNFESLAKESLSALHDTRTP